MKPIALIFDDTVRSDTTGVYCLRALERLAEVRHVRPGKLGEELDGIDPRAYRLFINIDDGLRYRLPPAWRPCVWWAIDTHLDMPWCEEKGRNFDAVFTAQRDGAEQLAAAGIERCAWLPLACDAEIHGRVEIAPQYDFCFVGNPVCEERTRLVALLAERFPNHFVGNRYFEEMAAVYSASRIVFNRSIHNDVNMRVFEALASGSLLLTNDLTDNGLSELFQGGEHLALYRDEHDLLEKAESYLRRDDLRKRIGAQGRAEVLARHTYLHRMTTLLGTLVEQGVLDDEETTRGPSTTVAMNGATTDDATTNGAIDEANDDSVGESRFPLAQLPSATRRFLHLGCGGGRLGAMLKRQRPEVYIAGVERDEPQANTAASRLDDVIAGDVEQKLADYPGEPFDAIVCDGVLQRAGNPHQLLLDLQARLADGGVVLARVPNVRNRRLLASLARGNWGWDPEGTIEPKDTQLFTRRDLVELFESAGYCIDTLELEEEGDNHQIEGDEEAVQVGPWRLHGFPAEERAELAAAGHVVVARAAPQESESPNWPVVPCEAPCVVGCVLSIRNRPPEVLERTLQTYEYQTTQPADKVLVDYGSDAEYGEKYAAVCRRYGWRLVAVPPSPDEWNLSDASNRGVDALDPSVNVVFKSDVDVLLGGDVLACAAAFGRDQLCLFARLGGHPRAEYPAGYASHEDFLRWTASLGPLETLWAEGTVAFPRSWFTAVGGYDVGYRGWGFDDSDLRLRAERTIGVHRVRTSLLVHQWHPEPTISDQIVKNHERYEQKKRSGEVVCRTRSAVATT